MSLPPYFTPAAFDLLTEFEHDPTAHFYHARRDDLKALVQQPFQRLMTDTVAHLPEAMTARLETRRNLYSRFLKNDFGQGGAWAHYWGALYPGGSRRTADIQLALWMDARLLQVSFYAGEASALTRACLIRNCRRLGWDLLALLPDGFTGENLLLAEDWETITGEDGRMHAVRALTWREWLEDPARGMFCLRVPFGRAQVTVIPGEELAARAARLLRAYFPLALCAMDEEPMGAIERFFDSSE
jgi:hypothetical protein